MRNRVRTVYGRVAVSAAAALVVAVGCASTPQESVELSMTMGEDLGALERAHLALVDRHFDTLEAEVDRLIDETYAPFIIEYSVDGFDLAGRLEETEPEMQAQLLALFVEGVQGEIESYRAELVQPIRRQRAELTANIRASYALLHYSNAALTGYLRSVYEVEQERMALMRAAGLERIEEASDATLAALGAAVREGTRRAQEVERSAGAIGQEIERLRDALEGEGE